MADRGGPVRAAPAGVAAANARCPRCGGAFHCGADEAACACALLTLDAAARAAIARRFAGCLCTACLTQMAQQAAASTGAADP